MEILIGAGIFVLVASISTAIFGYTIYSRNKTNQQNQINQTAKDFMDEIGGHLRSSRTDQKIKICGLLNYNPTDIIGGDELSQRKIGTELRIFYGSGGGAGGTNILYQYLADKNNNIQRNIYSRGSMPNCNEALFGPDSTHLNPLDVRLSNFRLPPPQNTQGPYLAFMGCDDYKGSEPSSSAWDGYAPIIRVIFGLESGVGGSSVTSKNTSSVFQTTFTTRRPPS